MGDVKIPKWLKKLPLAPEFHPTDTEFADPIAYISKIEKEASAFGICKVIPPLPKPSKKYVYSNLNKSLMKSPELGTDPSASLSSGDKGTWEGRAVFTTRQQELGHNLKRNKGQTTVKPSSVHKQVWQSGEVYTLEQFESKSKVFAKNQLGGIKDVTPLLVEALFWKAASDKPIYIEYANDVPGSGFGEPEDLSQYFRKWRRRTKFDQECQLGNSEGTPKIDAGKNSYEATSSVQCDSDPYLEVSDEGLTSRRLKVSNANKDGEGTAGWKLSNCPWNLQIIARSPGSLTRFMLGDIPGVTSPMVYIGMLFSWFAWHVEDHELHSLNYLHTGSSKTWYAVPGDYAFTFEEIIRSQGYGGNLDRLAALALLGEKTNLLSPAVVVASGIPCCRLVQNPGEFVVTFPRAYHVGFSHGFNCGEAANFGTPQWLKVAKEAAIRRAAMNYLPMLSHQQLLYLLTMSFVSRVPRALLPGERSSRLKDRQKEERELLVKKAFIDDMLNEHKLLSVLLGKESTFSAVLWDPESLSLASNVRQSLHISTIPEAYELVEGKRDADMLVSQISYAKDVDDEISNFSEVSNRRITADLQNVNAYQNQVDRTRMYMERSEDFCVDDDDLPCGLHVDSGTLACVACGILGFPFMSIVQPSEKALENLFPADSQSEGLGVLRSVKPGAHLSVDQSYITSSSDAEGGFCENKKQKVFSDCGRRVRITEASVYGNGASKMESCHKKSLNDTVTSSLSHHQLWENYSAYEKDVRLMEDSHDTSFNCTETLSAEAIGKELNDTTISPHQMWANYSEYDSLSEVSKLNSTGKGDKKWNKYSQLLRPRIFCLEHALETEKLLRARGGAHVLIICHSAYPKIKAHAMSAAEEIGASFDCDEVPLENASEEDLELINISICDEAHEEFSEDWTCRLGLNIHHCVKLRKLSQEKQEHALALGGLFSEAVSGSDISSLKWNSRRSRTSHKVIAQKESKSDQDIPIMKVDIQMEKQERKTSGDNKFTQYYIRKRRRDKVSPGYSTNQQLEKSSGINGFPDSGTPCSVRNTGYVSAGLTKCTSLEFGSRHEETRDMMSDQANFAGSPAIQNEGNDSHKTFATVEKMEIMQEVPKTAQTKDVNEVSDHAHPLVLFDMDNTGNDAVESSLVESERQHNGENKGVVISDPVTCASLHAVEDMGNDFHELVAFPTVENLEILDDGPQTGEMTEEYKLHDTGNAGNDIMESGEMPLKVTSRADELLDSAKSAVSRAIHDLVLQSLGTQMKIQVLEKDDYEESCEMQHALRTADDAQCDHSEMQHASSTQNFDGDRIMGETDVEDERCGMSSETYGRPQQSPTTSRMESGEGETITVDEVHRGEGVCSATMDTLVPESTICHRQGRDQNKKKRRAEQITEDEINYDAFIRSPCERLRPRNQKPQTGSEMDIKVEVESKKARRPPHSSSISKTKKEDTNREHTCDVEGCEMSFDTSSELAMHKRNWCTHEGCDKRFTSHKYVTLHQKVHLDDRPLKCPWKDCKMSFKWAWARTEHIRVHTGERPYQCKVEGCGLTFRYVSDFSRHRRKTGHHSNAPS